MDILSFLMSRGVQRIGALLAMFTVLYFAGAELDSWMVWCVAAIALVMEQLAWTQGVAHGVVMVTEMTDADRLKLKQILLELDNDIRD